jgi:hypothetical protein
MNQAQADQLYAAWLASQRSPLAALGFDPRRMAMSSAGPRLTAAGLYWPDADTMWMDSRYRSAPVHESMHRGFKLMKDAGMKTSPAEERAVRAMMLRNYGPVEKEPELSDDAPGNRQIAEAQKAMEDRGYREVLEAYDRDASELFQRRNRKMGPR